MRKVQQRASLHEKAVQAVARGEASLPAGRGQRERRTTKVTTFTVDPRVWAAVRAITKDPSRIVVCSATCVLVTNGRETRAEVLAKHRHP